MFRFSRTVGTLAGGMCLLLTGCITGNHLPPYPTPPKVTSEELPRATISFAPITEEAADSCSPTITLVSTFSTELPPPRPVPSEPLPSSKPTQEIVPELVLDLPTILGMIRGENLEINLAQEKIREAYARQLSANVLWLPSLQLGVSYNKHEGTLQASDGQIIDVSRSSLQPGLGVFAVGAGTPMIPGLFAKFHLKDALFQPKIQQQFTLSKKKGASAKTKEVLLSAALAYVNLLEAYQEKAIAAHILSRTQELADLTEKFARIGQGPQADADRMNTELSLRQNAIFQSEEKIRVASARLCELLRLDPTTLLLVQEKHLVPLPIVSCSESLRDLIASG